MTNVWSHVPSLVTSTHDGSFAMFAQQAMMARILHQLGDPTALHLRMYQGAVPDLPALETAFVAAGGVCKLREYESYGVAPEPTASGASPEGSNEARALVALLFFWEDAVVEIDVRASRGAVHLHLYAATAACFEALDTVVRAHLRRPVREASQGMLYTLAFTDGGLEFFELGVIGGPLTRENYTGAALAGVDAFVEAVAMASPPGRLLLVTGATGTGKTHLVYGLQHALPQAVFVLIQPSLVAHLADPSLLPSLVGLRERFAPDSPVVFWVEEADAVVVERGADNMSAVAALLALGDGPIGAALGMFVIATTNAGHTKLQLDRALERPMRMIAHVRLDPLPRAQAAAVWARLRPDDGPLRLDDETTSGAGTRPVALYEIYQAAFAAGWRPPPRPVATPRPRGSRRVRVRHG